MSSKDMATALQMFDETMKAITELISSIFNDKNQNVLPMLTVAVASLQSQIMILAELDLIDGKSTKDLLLSSLDSYAESLPEMKEVIARVRMNYLATNEILG